MRAVHPAVGEVVHVRWSYADGTTLDEEYSAPPEPTRKARQHALLVSNQRDGRAQELTTCQCQLSRNAERSSTK